MQDDSLDKLLRDRSNDRLPSESKRAEILRNVFGAIPSVMERRSRNSSARRKLLIAVLSGIGVVAATVLLALTILPDRSRRPVDDPGNISTTRNEFPTDHLPIRISILVLRRISGSESAVEFLEDAVLLAEGQKLHEIELKGHRLFLWIYPLEKSLFSLDVGIDKAGEAGIVAVPDKTQALKLRSNGDCFDVFVSVLPNT